MKSCQFCKHGTCLSLFQNIWTCDKHPGWQRDGWCPDDDKEEEQHKSEATTDEP